MNCDPFLEITENLLLEQAAIAPKFFYDSAGCVLFEKITTTAEYYPTRTEAEILSSNAVKLKEKTTPVSVVIEPGAGNCQKAEKLCQILQPKSFVAVDIAEDFLKESLKRFQSRLPEIQTWGQKGDLVSEVVLPAWLPQEERLVFYPGSSIGNFAPVEATRLLKNFRDLVQHGGQLLIGVDLEKDVAVLESAYNDSQGLTAEFNGNILRHVNRLIGSNFDLANWEHVAWFNSQESRIEMHLRAKKAHTVSWQGYERRFCSGETIHTENSYKYSIPKFQQVLRQAGFETQQVFTDSQSWYGLFLAEPCAS